MQLNTPLPQQSSLTFALHSDSSSSRMSLLEATPPAQLRPRQSRSSILRRQSMIEVSRISRRIHGWSWQAFPIGMGTGAVYVTLSGLKPHPGPVMTMIETVFFFINMALFLLNISTLLLQLIVYPRQAKRLITDPVKGIFVPLVVLSFATIIIGTINYAVPAGHISPNVIYALFWTYVGLSVGVCFPMLMIWFNKPHDLKTFTPAWAFLIFPMMLVGVVAFNVLRVIGPEEPRALGVLLTGYIFQGLGFFMTFFYICIYIIRIMTTGFLEGHQANGAFVACGPPGFTALALINLGEKAQAILRERELVSEVAGEVWYAGSIMAALLLFGLAVFFFAFGALPYWFKLHKHLSEILGCWALTFPNVGWILTLRKLGDIFHIHGFHVWHFVMTVLMFLTWVILFVLTIVAFWKGKIFMAAPEDIIRDTLSMDRREKQQEPDTTPSASQEDLEKGLTTTVMSDVGMSECPTAVNSPGPSRSQSFDVRRLELKNVQSLAGSETTFKP